MKRVYIEELAGLTGQSVTLQGWAANVRSSGKLLFLTLRDGSGFLQCVGRADELPDRQFQALAGVQIESAVRVEGTLRADPRAAGGVELSLTGFELLAESHDYPLQKKEHGPGFLLPLRHLWLRSRRQWAIMRVRSVVELAWCEYLDSKGYVRVDAPVLTPSACEGSTTLFETDYFGEKAYLTQSGQLYNEAAAYALGRVYCFGPALRAEKSKTRRHLAEFWQCEPEAAFADTEEMLELAEGMLQVTLERVLERCPTELELLGRERAALERVKAPLPRLDYSDAVRLVNEAGGSMEEGEDFGGDETTLLTSRFDTPFAIMAYPASIKPFYMKRDEGRPDRADCFDIYAPEGFGEIVGGSAREPDPDLLLERIREEGADEEDYRWYLQIRRYGRVPSAGFGMGLERLLQWLLGIDHIRETAPFPRTLEKIYP